MNNPSASIVVCTHRHVDELASMLSALKKDVPEPTEILIVRSGTTAASLPLSSSEALPDGIRTVFVAEPGTARARDAGLREASTEVVMWLDDDARPRPGWYRELIRPLSNPDIGAVGGTIIPVWPEGRRPGWLPHRLATYFGERHAGAAAGHHPFGANMAVRRSACLEVGGLNVALGHSGSTPGLHAETDLCERLSAAGYRIEEAPGAIVEHSIRPEQISVRWVLRRAWHHGRSDVLRDLASGATDTPTRIVKLIGLSVLWPVALFHRRSAVYVTARVLVNLAYLRDRVGGAG